MSSNIRQALQVPVKEATPPWDQVISAIQELSPPEGLTKNQKFLITQLQVDWVIGLHYLYQKKWNNRHKLPIRFQPKTQKIYKLFGEYLYQLVELCTQCHAWQKTPYPNAAHWFFAIAWEMHDNSLMPITEHGRSGESKRSWLVTHKSNLKTLKDYGNPCDPEEEPHYYRLIDTARSMAEQPGEFYRKQWKPFLKAYSEYVNEVAENPMCQVVFEKDEKLRYSSGRGKGSLPLPEL
ncbi:hypothetical protein [Trichocoleus sp. FACHB-262]|uniref:hypothetical protein n=1 Tax=Trichocoleus sp. FACHB-262 TaxID=2692869 RepID=UPI0016864F7B|nr:hypothetical protein [Trichocoleus sp. FACHB-262]MBD2120317.1 hypothetical protein [Trichocoleus sp. FACHB-262]